MDKKFKTIYLDMDGVVSNFQKLALEAFGVANKPEMWETYSIGDKLGLDSKQFWFNLIKGCRLEKIKKTTFFNRILYRITTFFNRILLYIFILPKNEVHDTFIFDKNVKVFEACECYEWANDLVNMCLKYADRVCFLSCVGYSYPDGFTEKVNWLIKHNMNKKKVGIILMKNREKDLLVSKNGPVCLIDDYQDNIDEFINAGGYGIKFPAKYNKDIAHHLSDPVTYIEAQLKQQIEKL